MLFFGGLKLLFPALFAKMGIAVAGFLSAAWAPLLIALAIVIAIAVGIWLAWKTNFMNLVE